jgi:hypothetical protein
VEGDVLVGHGGRTGRGRGRGCRLGSCIDVVEVSRVCKRRQATSVLARRAGTLHHRAPRRLAVSCAVACNAARLVAPPLVPLSSCPLFCTARRVNAASTQARCLVPSGTEHYSVY